MMTKIKPLHERLFPQLANSKWLHNVNLNDHVRGHLGVDVENRKETLLDPRWCDAFVKGVHSSNFVDYSFGGYGEDRSNLWKDSYLQEKGTFIHQGIDYNVPAGTAVYLPGDAFIVRHGTDTDQNGGWGSYVDFFFEQGKDFKKALDDFQRNRFWQGIEASGATYVRLAHLHSNYKMRERMRIQRKGELVGFVGKPQHNGGWYPHLHVQCMNSPFIRNTFQWEQHEFDGYGKDLGRSVDPEKTL
jgi:murein DD-endopeptidase MepM/ murein hydrolase activator NlpD